MNCKYHVLTVLIVAVFLPSVVAYDHTNDFVAQDQSTWPTITIIIDDLGNSFEEGEQAINLPGPVAYAVLPHTPFGHRLAQQANELGKEVMLHLPLEAVNNNQLLGQGAITMDDSYAHTSTKLTDNLQSVPFAVGLNNHMGSLLTRHPGHMRWLMQAIKENGELFFVDSFTTGRSVALSIAREYNIPAIKRDIFLDSVQDHEAVARQFDRLKQRARLRGYAVAIGHPFPETLDVLEKELPRLTDLGYRLVGVRSAINRQQSLRSGIVRSKTLSIAEEPLVGSAKTRSE